MAKRPRKPKEQENKPGKYDPRNKLNDLTGKEWLLRTKSFWMTESCALDKSALAHPAPFMIVDASKLITMFTKADMTVLDPFVGSGTTLLAAGMNGRNSIGIDLNSEYKELYEKRRKEAGDDVAIDGVFIIGDSLNELDKLSPVDYILTSPPYHNILRNDSKGLRNLDSGKQYRVNARDGVEYYSENERDLGNQATYRDFLDALEPILSKCFALLKSGKYMTIIMSDFTVDKKEVCVQGDIVPMMQGVGFEFCGTTVLLQPEKPLFPFGYPYAYKINHDHQNIMTFRKPKTSNVEMLKEQNG